jgi:serine/threonine protein phosphatase PrpC
VVEGRANEDAVLTIRDHPYFDALMLLADGMGGHPEPRLAAQTAVAAARDYLLRPEWLAELIEQRGPLTEILRRSVELANREVCRLAARVPAGSVAEKPPGCTLTVAVVGDGRFAAAHVGDGSVFLVRDDRLHPLAGGEARRVGSRPEEFLGRADRIEIETVAGEVRPGDRLLLCTDGLTRYFGAADRSPSGAGSAPTPTLERLQQVVARRSADPQTLANQLTADGRGERYEDDTTVVVAEIGASREAPDPVPPQPATRTAGPDRSVAEAPRAGGGRRWAIGALLLTVAAGLVWWRPWERFLSSEPSPLRQARAPAVDLTGLPHGGVLLVEQASGRLYLLRTRPVGTPAAGEPLTLRELRFVPGQGVVDTANSYQLDPARGRLTAPSGRTYPVTVDGGSGLIEVQQSGVLRVETQPPGLPVRIDGFSAGVTPVKQRLRAGSHQVQIMGRWAAGKRQVLRDTPWEVPAGAETTLRFVLSGQSAGRVRP